MSNTNMNWTMQFMNTQSTRRMYMIKQYFMNQAISLYVSLVFIQLTNIQDNMSTV